MATGMPTIQEVAANFSRGGTASDPNLAAESGPNAEVTTKTEEPAVEEKTEAAPEAPKEEVKEEVKEEEKKEAKKDPTSSRFAALSRREREVRQRQIDAEARLKAIDDREKALSDREARLKNVKRPIEAMKELGFSYADLTQDALGNYKEKEVDPVDEKLKPVHEKLAQLDAVEQKLAAWEKQLAARDQEAQIRQVDEAIGTTIKDDKYELTRSMGEDGVSLVKDVIVEYFNREGKMLDYAEACDIVEKYYEEDLLGRLMSTKKLRSKVPEPTKPVPTKQRTSSAREPSTTLKNSHTSAAQATVDIDKLPKHEAIKELAKRLRFIET